MSKILVGITITEYLPGLESVIFSEQTYWLLDTAESDW